MRLRLLKAFVAAQEEWPNRHFRFHGAAAPESSGTLLRFSPFPIYQEGRRNRGALRHGWEWVIPQTAYLRRSDRACLLYTSRCV